MKRFFKMAAVCAAVIFCCGCSVGRAGADEQGGAVVQHTDVVFGTVVQMSLYSKEKEASQQAADDVMELLRSLERDQISWRLDTSEVYRINKSAGGGQGIALSDGMKELLEQSLEISEKSKGAFDITLGPLVQLWKIDSWAAGEEAGNVALPSQAAVREALGKCGFGRLLMVQGKQEGEKLLKLPQGMQLDLGAVGKGYAQSETIKLLENHPEITGAVISLGGSVLTWGSKPDGDSWRIGITDPADTGSYVGILELSGQWCISTSGDYERYVELDGVRYHHILDPSTGYPADSGVRGVTILSKEGLSADALSTACFILGSEKGMELAEEYGAEALFILSDGEMVLSEGMEKYLTVWTDR